MWTRKHAPPRCGNWLAVMGAHGAFKVEGLRAVGAVELWRQARPVDIRSNFW